MCVELAKTSFTAREFVPRPSAHRAQTNPFETTVGDLAKTSRFDFKSDGLSKRRTAPPNAAGHPRCWMPMLEEGLP